MKIGDYIMVVDDNLEGIITSIAEEVTFETSDGFEFTYPKSKVTVVQKRVADTFLKGNPRPKILRTLSKKSAKKNKQLRVFDLHIEKIASRHVHLSAGQKLQLQIDEVKRIIFKMQKVKTKEFVLIHGVGAGVLKNEIIKLLKSKKMRYSEASYVDYGHGALRVCF